MKYKSIKTLKERCEEYMLNTDLVAPRSFRIYIGVSKQTLSYWKKKKPKFFDLVKSYEDKILAKVEEYALYGQAHPDIKKNLVTIIPRKTYYKDGTIKTDTYEAFVTGKYNQVGAIFTLRAYDKVKYMPEKDIRDKTDDAKVIIDLGDNKSPIRIAKKELTNGNGK